jgi:hypothetical protein
LLLESAGHVAGQPEFITITAKQIQDFGRPLSEGGQGLLDGLHKVFKGFKVLGLYAIYQQRGADFLPQYKALLDNSGMHSAADLAAGFGIDLRSPEFWQASLALIEQRIARFEALEP